MNFTREPIIETIISPREGCKLLVRSSKSSGVTEEYYVDAVEVVSFGRAFFFRSMERPKAFLVPTSDYEVLEVKEARVALKSVSHDRNIKIGGGREASLRHSHREPPQESENEPVVAEEEQPPQAETGLEAAIGARMEKRRDRRRRRHRRSDEEWGERRNPESQQAQHSEGGSKIQGGSATDDETKVSPPMFLSLIPPPSTLISETLSRDKDKDFAEETLPPKEISEEKESPKKGPSEEKKETSGPDSESNLLQRSVLTSNTENSDAASFNSIHFSPLQMGRDSFFF